MRQRASKLKCRNCGGSSNVSYAPYPRREADRPAADRQGEGEARGDAVLTLEALTVSVYGVPQPAGSKP